MKKTPTIATSAQRARIPRVASSARATRATEETESTARVRTRCPHSEIQIKLKQSATFHLDDMERLSTRSKTEAIHSADVLR